jgi:hypothetical protein
MNHHSFWDTARFRITPSPPPLLTKGDHEAALILVLMTILQMTEEEVNALRSSPVWASRLATAKRVARRSRVGNFVPSASAIGRRGS